MRHCLGNQDADTTSSLDLLLGTTAEEAGLDDGRLGGDGAATEDLGVAGLEGVDDGDGITGGLGHGQGVELAQVQGGAVVSVGEQVELAHTQLAKEARMEAVKVGPVMGKATSLTATSGMLAVLAHTTVAGGDVAAKLPGLFQSRDLREGD